MAPQQDTICVIDESQEQLNYNHSSIAKAGKDVDMAEESSAEVLETSSDVSSDGEQRRHDGSVTGTLRAYYTLLKSNKGFLYLFMGGNVSLLGDWLSFVACIALVRQLSDKYSAVGGYMMINYTSAALFQPVIGVVVDRYDRRWVMICADFSRFFLALALIPSLHFGLVYFYIICFLKSVCGGFFEPAKNGVLPNVVSEQDLVIANTLSATMFSVMLFFGAGLGGLFTAAFGITANFLFDALSFLLSASFVLYGLRGRDLRAKVTVVDAGETDSAGGEPKANALILSDSSSSDEAESVSEPVQKGCWQMFTSGWRYHRENPDLLCVTFLKAGNSFAVGTLDIVVTVTASSKFKVNGSETLSLGIVWAMLGVGTLIGPLVSRKYGNMDIEDPMSKLSLRKWLAAALLNNWVWYSLLALAPNFPLFLLCAVLAGAGDAIVYVNTTTVLQTDSVDEYRGRVFSLSLALRTLCEAIGSVTGGQLLDTAHWSVFTTAMVVGTTPIILSLVVFLVFYWPWYKRHWERLHGDSVRPKLDAIDDTELDNLNMVV